VLLCRGDAEAAVKKSHTKPRSHEETVGSPGTGPRGSPSAPQRLCGIRIPDTGGHGGYWEVSRGDTGNAGRGAPLAGPSPSVFIRVIRGSNTLALNPWKDFAGRRRERRVGNPEGPAGKGLTQRRKARNATDKLRWVMVGRLSWGNVAAFAALREKIRKPGGAPGGPTPLRLIGQQYARWKGSIRFREHWSGSSVCWSPHIRVHL
jgi:hypothetical protein